MSPKKIRCLLFLLLAIFSLNFVFSHPAEAAPASTEYKIKAAMTVKFTEFVNWPVDFDRKKFFTMCFAGTDNFGDSLDALKDQKIKNKTLKIKRGIANEDIASCDLVFIGETSDIRIKQIVDIAKDKPILTIGETDDFIRKGGIIELFIFQSKVNFKVNLPASKNADLTISSDLLSLAKEVIR